MVDINEYFNNYYRGSKNTTLDSMRYFIKEYNNFQAEMKFIHIAGTNGKGSCTEIITNILIKQGYKVGKFLTPHLVNYNERISINNENISNEEMSILIKELEPKIKEYNKINNNHVTYFDLITIIALIYFYRSKVDFVVLETGLGGLTDSTNAITKPLVSIITSIGYDHMSILGNTLEDITYQKAGIIKENSNTVFFEQSPQINKIIIDTCKEKNNILHLIQEKQIKNYSYDKNYQYFDYENYKNTAINLKGDMQIKNAIVCIECMKILNKLGYIVSEASIREGLKTVIHKARMEIINDKPLIIYDGAHNYLAIDNFRSAIKTHYKNFKRRYIISILKRKDYEKMIKLLLEDKEAEFIFTSGNNSKKYATGEELYNIAMKYIKKQKVNVKKLEDSISYIFEDNNNNIANFFVGSLYTYGDVLNQIEVLTKNKKMI